MPRQNPNFSAKSARFEYIDDHVLSEDAWRLLFQYGFNNIVYVCDSLKTKLVRIDSIEEAGWCSPFFDFHPIRLRRRNGPCEWGPLHVPVGMFRTGRRFGDVVHELGRVSFDRGRIVPSRPFAAPSRGRGLPRTALEWTRAMCLARRRPCRSTVLRSLRIVRLCVRFDWGLAEPRSDTRACSPGVRSCVRAHRGPGIKDRYAWRGTTVTSMRGFRENGRGFRAGKIACDRHHVHSTEDCRLRPPPSTPVRPPSPPFYC